MTNNLVALVTGANKGLGKETARQLGPRGVTVLLGSRDPGRGETTARELAAEGLSVTPVQIDVTDAGSVKRAAAELMRQYGRLDILVNNAGTFANQAALDTTAVQMRRTFEANVFGVVTVIDAMLPLLRHAAAPRIVNISSTTASLTMTSAGSSFGNEGDILDYASSKAAVNMLTLPYANAFRRDETLSHIKINAATPGYIATDLNNHRGGRSVEQGARIVVKLATLPDDGPSGGFFNDQGAVPW